MAEPEKPTKSGGPLPPASRASGSEVALIGPEFSPVYANFIRDFTDLPPPPHGGNEVFTP